MENLDSFLQPPLITVKYFCWTPAYLSVIKATDLFLLLCDNFCYFFWMPFWICPSSREHNCHWGFRGERHLYSQNTRPRNISVDMLFYIVPNVEKVKGWKVKIQSSVVYADQSDRLVGRLDRESNAVATSFVTRGLDARRWKEKRTCVMQIEKTLMLEPQERLAAQCCIRELERVCRSEDFQRDLLSSSLLPEYCHCCPLARPATGSSCSD